jgi:hypothetical protein
MLRPLSGRALESKTENISELADCYGGWIGIRSNHVITKTGSFTDSAGSTRGISTKEDLELLLALRERADLLVVDASTARIESYKALKHTPMAIFSASGNFVDIPAASGSNVFLLTPSDLHGDNPELQTRLVSTTIDNPFGTLIAWAKTSGYESILLETGASMTKMAFELGLVEQSAITFTPQLMASELESFTNPFDSSAICLSLAETDTASFSFWQH